MANEPLPIGAGDLSISALDLAVILYHVHKGAQTKDVGFEDCERTLSELTEELTEKRVRINHGALESALWSCNLMDEIGEFWQPNNEDFDNFLSRVLKYASPNVKLTFNKYYNQVKVVASK